MLSLDNDFLPSLPRYTHCLSFLPAHNSAETCSCITLRSLSLLGAGQREGEASVHYISCEHQQHFSLFKNQIDVNTTAIKIERAQFLPVRKVQIIALLIRTGSSKFNLSLFLPTPKLYCINLSGSLDWKSVPQGVSSSHSEYSYRSLISHRKWLNITEYSKV